jgi:hypothetical protein
MDAARSNSVDAKNLWKGTRTHQIDWGHCCACVVVVGQSHKTQNSAVNPEQDIKKERKQGIRETTFI